jgi:hypothetical protein
MNGATQSFAYETHEVRVVFGAGSIETVAEEIERRGWKKAMLLTTPGRVEDREELLILLGARLAGEFNGAQDFTSRWKWSARRGTPSIASAPIR